jgi:hypothetical protein
MSVRKWSAGLLLAGMSLALAAPAQAYDFTGGSLLTGPFYTKVKASKKLNGRIEVGYRYIDRDIDGDGISQDELGGIGTLYYGNFFGTGSFYHSVSDDDFVDSSWQFSKAIGYQFPLGPDLTVAPVIGYGLHRTRAEFGLDVQHGGLHFGAGAKWTPKWAGKPFPKWGIFGSFLYFPDNEISDDEEDAGFDGDDGFVASFGIEHNFTEKFFANIIYQYSNFNVSGFGDDFEDTDHRIGFTVGSRL